MPPFDLSFIKRPAIGLGRRIGQGFDFLGDQLDPDADPAELEQVRRALPPTFNGGQNPATQPRPVLPNPNAPMASDRPPSMVNRPRLPIAAPQPSSIPGGEPPRPAFLDREIAPPTKSYGHERLDYLDQNSGRGFKQSLKAGLRSGAQSMRDGGRGGGFLGGLIGNLVDPRGEADRAFAAGPGARILQRQEMERGDELYNLKRDQQAANLDTKRLQAENYRGLIGDRQLDNQRQATELEYKRPYYEAQAKAEEAQAKLREAQAESARRGTAVTIDVDEGAGKINTYRVFPDGSKVLVGPSARAHYEREQNRTSVRNTDARNQTSTRNTERRIAARPAAPVRKKDTYITDDDIQGVADETGVDFNEALRGLLNEGYKRAPNQRLPKP